MDLFVRFVSARPGGARGFGGAWLAGLAVRSDKGGRAGTDGKSLSEAGFGAPARIGGLRQLRSERAAEAPIGSSTRSQSCNALPGYGDVATIGLLVGPTAIAVGSVDCSDRLLWVDQSLPRWPRPVVHGAVRRSPVRLAAVPRFADVQGGASR